MYSDISILTIDSSESNNSDDNVLAKWVLPLPDEPKNKNEPNGY